MKEIEEVAKAVVALPPPLLTKRGRLSEGRSRSADIREVITTQGRTSSSFVRYLRRPFSALKSST